MQIPVLKFILFYSPQNEKLTPSGIDGTSTHSKNKLQCSSICYTTRDTHKNREVKTILKTLDSLILLFSSDLRMEAHTVFYLAKFSMNIIIIYILHK